MKAGAKSSGELLIKSTQTHDEEIIREVAYIPAAISIRAIKIRDHFIFQKFLKFIPYFHHLGYREPDKNVRGFIHDRGVAWLKEIANYFIEPELKNAKEEALKEKIAAVDNAVERIEEISKTSPTNQ